MNGFLNTYEVPKLKEEDTKIQHKPVSVSEIEDVIKNMPTRKIPVPDGFTAEFYEKFRKHIIMLLLKFFNEIERKQYSQILRSKHYPDTKARMDPTQKENYRSVFLMNINEKILNKILANRMQESIKIIHHD